MGRENNCPLSLNNLSKLKSSVKLLFVAVSVDFLSINIHC